jgi:hypothetical protein
VPLPAPCESGAVCLWKHSDFSGTCWYIDYGHEIDYSVKTYGSWCNESDNDLNDSVSSIINNGNSMNTRHYTGANYTGYYKTLPRGQYWSLVWRNDQLSSHRWVS